MEKRLILAIALSLLILITWSAFVSKSHHIDTQEVTEKQPIVVEEVPFEETKEPPSFISEEKQPPANLFPYETERLGLTFTESQAAIKEVVFRAYKDYPFPLKSGFLIADKSLIFKKTSSSYNKVTFEHSGQNKRIRKSFVFSNANYTIDLEIEIQNLSQGPINFKPQLVLGILDFSNGVHARYKDLTAVTKQKTFHHNARKDSEFEDLQFLSLRDRYFCAIIQPYEPNNFSGYIHTLSKKESEIGINFSPLILSPGQSTKLKFHIYLGPQDLELINKINPEWSAVVYYGFFDLISQALLHLLRFLHSVVHNWGLAILILSFIVYILVYPLTIKQMRSMKEMQALQPQIEELRKKYKDNPQKMNKELMGLYKEHKVNPFGGCFPLLLQFPVFISLFQALMRSVALKGASFLWIKDLSEPDRLFILPFSLPLLGSEVNILPILMTIGMFLQQKFSMAQAQATASEQQKIMTIMFPLIFFFIFYRMPSGLVLYWFVNSSLMLLNQLRIRGKK